MASSSMMRVGVFVDGGFFAAVSNFFRHEHRRSARLDVDAVVRRCKREAAGTRREQMLSAVDVVVKRYYRGRFSAQESASTGHLKTDRLWEDVLLAAGFETRYYPCGDKGEKAIDVMLAVDAMELVARDAIDVAAFVTGDEDFVPLFRALKRFGVPPVLVSWDRPQEGDFDPSDHSHFAAAEALRREAAVDVDLFPLCDGRSLSGDQLFVSGS